jgi:tetratricopeptide (TPR) repeat protein
MKKAFSLIVAITVLLAAFAGCGAGTNSESLDTLIALGAQYLVDGEYGEAIVAFDKAIKVDNKSVVAYVGLGDANLGLEDYEKAGDAYERAIEIDDQTVEAYIGRADVYLFEGNSESAVAALNEGYEVTGSAKLSSIVEEINAGTYEPTVLHMDWESMRDTVNNNADVNGDDEVRIAKWIDYFDSNGEQVKGEGYDASGNLVETKTFKEGATDINGERDVQYYDEDGNFIKFEEYASDGALQSYMIFKYGTGEYPIEGESYDADGIIRSTTYYDEDFNLVKSKSVIANNFNGSWEVGGYEICYYDGEGNVTKSEIYDLDGNLIDIQ